MRVAIIGANGQLGSDLVATFKGHEVFPWTRTDFDLRHHPEAAEIVTSVKPDVLINTAALNKTDTCDQNPELAFAVNAIAVRNLARACERCGTTIVQVSSDYVFDGEKGKPYSEKDCPRPINVYGLSKLAGEHSVSTVCRRHYIVRVASLFGRSGSRTKGGNFVETMLARGGRGETLTVVDDITMSPTYTVDAAEGIKALIAGEARFGVYHLTNAGACTWHAFAREILRQAGLDVELLAAKTAPSDVRRPPFSALTSERMREIGLPALRRWEEALTAYLGARAQPRGSAAP